MNSERSSFSLQHGLKGPMLLRLFLVWVLFQPLAFAKRGDAQLSRFDAPVSDLEAILDSSNSASTILDALIQQNARIKLFQLQALLAVYEDPYPELDGWRKKIKGFEDRLGTVVDAGKHVEFAEKVGASPAVVEFLKKEQLRLRREFIGWMRQKGWIEGAEGESPLSWLRNDLSEVDWKGYGEDRELVLKAYRKRIRDVRSYPHRMDLMQAGIHELRRDLRMLTIFPQAFRLFLIDDRFTVEDRYEALRDTPHWKSPYLTLLPSRFERFPVYLPRGYLAEIARLTDALGEVKDIGEAQFEWLPHALVATGAMNAGDTEAIQSQSLQWVKKHSSYVPVFATAKKLRDEIKDSPLLAGLRASLKQKQCEFWPLVE